MRHPLLFARRLPSTELFGILAITLIWLMVSAASWPARAAETVISGARIGGTEDRTRFVADLQGDLQYTITALQNPDRVTIEFGAAKFDLPAGVGKKSRGLVRELRYGAAADGQSKIVLLTKAPVAVADNYIIPADGKRPARLVIDIIQGVAGTSPPEEPLAPVVFPTEQPAEEPSTVATQQTVRTIVIDPGHGGADPGTVSANGILEKDIVLNFAKALQASLESTGRYKVILTRSNDTFIKLQQRSEIARNSRAELFLALHADSVKTKSTRGATLYTLSEKASDAEADALAQKENRSNIIAGFDLPTQNNQIADVLIQLAQRESANFAAGFSKRAVAKLEQVIELTGKPMRSAGFAVLKAPDVPSVLIELGYLSNPKDEKLLQSREWQQIVSKALTAAIDEHFVVDVALKDGSEDAAGSP